MMGPGRSSISTARAPSPISNRRAIFGPHWVTQRETEEVDLPADSRWANFAGGFDATGRVVPMSLGHLRSLADDLESSVSGLPDAGALSLLATSRKLLVQAWFEYELLVLACSVSLQAVEAAFRAQLYPDKHRRTAFKNLVDLAERDQVLSSAASDQVRAGVRLRNRLAHPTGLALYSPGMAEQVITTAHRVVGDVLRASEGAAGP